MSFSLEKAAFMKALIGSRNSILIQLRVLCSMYDSVGTVDVNKQVQVRRLKVDGRPQTGRQDLKTYRLYSECGNVGPLARV